MRCCGKQPTSNLDLSHCICLIMFEGKVHFHLKQCLVVHSNACWDKYLRFWAALYIILVWHVKAFWIGVIDWENLGQLSWASLQKLRNPK